MRSIALLVVGAIVGGAAIYLVKLNTAAFPGASRPEPGAGLPDTAPLTESASEISGVIIESPVVATRIAAYERAIEATDALDLEAMLDISATAPRSRSRDLEIGALLERLAELDPLRAVDYAQSAFLDTRFLVQAFEALARADSDSAIAQLSLLQSAAKRRQVAIALLNVLGTDVGTAERIASSLPEGDRASFELDAVIARAEVDPFGVLTEVFAGNLPGAQNFLLAQLAEVAARHDPLAALAFGEQISDLVMARSFEFAVLNAWSAEDPDAVFTWLENAEPTELALSSGSFATLARSDPDRLLAMADDFPPAARASARRAVVQAYAERDPISALAMLDTLPPGPDRESLLQTIGQTYGSQEPETALAWARSLSPPSPNVVQAVLQGIARVDVDRAIDLFIAELEEQGSSPFMAPTPFGGASMGFMMMFSTLSYSGGDVGRLADKLLDTNDPRTRSMLSLALSTWSSRDPNAAFGWTLANADRLDADAMRNVSRNMAQADLDLALSTLEQLPAAHRAGWMDGVAFQLAQSDPDRARSFLDRYRGQPGYDGAIGTVAQTLARSDPAAAARLLAESGSPTAFQRASFQVAREWANRDPLAAARWAIEEVTDSQTQTRALSTIASTWAQRDSAAAERWLFGLGSGPNRDAAADGFLTAAAQVGRFEPRLLEAYSSQEASQRGASQAITLIGRTNPDRAGELMDTYISDPAIRAETEAQIARMSAAQTGSLSQGVFIF